MSSSWSRSVASKISVTSWNSVLEQRTDKKYVAVLSSIAFRISGRPNQVDMLKTLDLVSMSPRKVKVIFG